MTIEVRREPSIEGLVKDYLHGEVSIEDAISALPTPKYSIGELFLKVILPGDMFRRRLERMSRLHSHVLVTGSKPEDTSER
jgi:hypothetical protein